MADTQHLRAVTSERGLVYLPPIETGHRIAGGRERVRAEVQTSSAVEPSIWLRVTDEIGVANDGGGIGPLHTGDVVELALHLSHGDAVRLAEQIMALTVGEPSAEIVEG